MTELEKYFFDLNGHIILPNVIPSGILAQLNADWDGMRDLAPGHWLSTRERDFTGPKRFGCRVLMGSR